MVPLLVLDIGAHHGHLRWTDADRAYPSCQANLPNVSFIYREEFAFRSGIDSLTGRTGGRRSRRCTWFWVPPAASTSMPLLRAIPRRLLIRRSRLRIKGARFLVVKTTCSR